MISSTADAPRRRLAAVPDPLSILKSAVALLSRPSPGPPRDAPGALQELSDPPRYPQDRSRKKSKGKNPFGGYSSHPSPSSSPRAPLGPQGPPGAQEPPGTSRVCHLKTSLRPGDSGELLFDRVYAQARRNRPHGASWVSRAFPQGGWIGNLFVICGTSMLSPAVCRFASQPQHVSSTSLCSRL